MSKEFESFVSHRRIIETVQTLVVEVFLISWDKVCYMSAFDLETKYDDG